MDDLTALLWKRALPRLVPNPDGCWIWIGAVNSNGYGNIGARVTGKLVSRSVHRVAYAAVIGTIPTDLQIDHICRVRCCANPDHLRAVTGRENMRNSEQALKTRCKHGHEFTPSNTFRRPNGTRECVTCKRAKYRFAA